MTRMKQQRSLVLASLIGFIVYVLVAGGTRLVLRRAIQPAPDRPSIEELELREVEAIKARMGPISEEPFSEELKRKGLKIHVQGE